MMPRFSSLYNGFIEELATLAKDRPKDKLRLVTSQIQVNKHFKRGSWAELHLKKVHILVKKMLKQHKIGYLKYLLRNTRIHSTEVAAVHSLNCFLVQRMDGDNFSPEES